MIRPRKPNEPGYLGPAAEAERSRELIRAAQAAPRQPRREQDTDPSSLALFAAVMQPGLPL